MYNVASNNGNTLIRSISSILHRVSVLDLRGLGLRGVLD